MSKMKKVLALVCVGVLVASVAVLAACSSKAEVDKNKTYVIATDTAFAPFEYQLADGTSVGIDMDIIKAIAEKAMSPAILSNYSAVMDAAGGSIETSMTQAEIGALAKMQLSSSEDWNIESYAVTGYVDSRTTYSYGASPLSVVIPEESSIAEARLLLQENQN